MPPAGRPGAPPIRTFKTKPHAIKPLRIKRSPTHYPEPSRPSSLATREGGIGARPHHSGHSQLGVDPTYALMRDIETHGRHRPSLDVYHAPIIGHTGVLGALTDLAKMSDPVALAHTLAKTARHPLYSRSATGLNAGVVVGGPGGLHPEVPREQALYHGSPEGGINKIDALWHTKAWREGQGFYVTSDFPKALKYARGKTASAERRAANAGRVTRVRLKPDAKVLNVDKQPQSFWHGLAQQVVGEKIDPKTYAEWAKDVGPKEAKGASEGVVNRERLMHFLTGWAELPKTDAYYAIEEAIAGRGYHATLHHEGGHQVYVVKDANALEHVGTITPAAPVAPKELDLAGATKELLRLQRRTVQAEKRVEAAHGPQPKGAASGKDWKAFSRSRGYTESEIADFERWLNLNKKYPGLKPDMVVGGKAIASPQAIKAHMEKFGPVVIPSSKTIAAKAGETRIVQRPATFEEAQKRLRVLDRQLEGFYRQVEQKIGHPLAEGDIAQEIGRSRTLFGGRASGKSVEGRVTGAPVKRASVKQELRAAALQHLEKLASKHPDHPSVKAWVRAEEERTRLMQDLHGHGPGEDPTLPVVAEVKLTPETAIARSLNTARGLARDQKKLYSEELSKRVAKGQAAAEEAGGGSAGHAAFMRELRGELPKVTFENLRNGVITKGDLDQLARHLDFNPDLTPFEKLTVNEALRHAVDRGKAFTPSEIKLMQRVYGQDAAALIEKHASVWRKFVDASNIPRSLMASFDLSAPFRQGLVAGARHPVIFAKNFKPMFKSFASETSYQNILDEIHSRPNAELYQEAGLNFTELRGLTAKDREEQFSSQYAERIPGVGHVVRASGRAYTGFLDRMRADMFDEQLRLARKAGVNVEDYQQLRGIARVVNQATGRGDLGPVESWAPALNAVFFSPRLIASRVNLLNPIWYGTLPSFARRQAIRSMVQLGAAAGGLLATGTLLGGKVTSDPRSADFAKLRLGNTRIDELGGIQQYVRLAAQLGPSQLGGGKIISSTTGKVMTLGPGYGKLNREDIAKRFIVSKFSPPASFIDDMAKGTTFAGQPFSVKNAVISRMVPLVAQDAYDVYKTKKSISLALLGYSISMFGIGMQTYGPPKAKPKRYGGSGGGSSNPLLGGGSSGNPYLSGGGSSANPYLP